MLERNKGEGKNTHFCPIQNHSQKHCITKKSELGGVKQKKAIPAQWLSGSGVK